MESTPMEEKVRAFIKAHMDGTDGTELSYIEKVYTDMPRQDVSRSSFPRIRVVELPSQSVVVHNTSTREYEAVLQVQIFVDMDSPLTIDGVKVAPEVMCARIGYKIIDLLNDNWKSELYTPTDNPMEINTISYNRQGIDNDYFDNLNVYKGSVEFTGRYWR